MKSLPFVLVLAATAALPLSVCTPAFAEPQAAAAADSPAKRCALAFIEMVNDGSADAVRKFEATWASRKRLGVASIDERITRFADMHSQWGKATVTNVSSSPEGLVSLSIELASGGSAIVSMEMSAEDPAKLDGIIIESAGPGVKSLPLTAEARASTVEGAAKALREGYVYPELGAKMADTILAKLKDGGYDAVADEAALARTLTADLRAVSHDGHLGVALRPQSSEGEASAHAVMPGGDQMRRENYAFRKVERLEGNIGYLAFDLFIPDEEAKKTAAAALAFLRNCDALIFDLRSNGGGSPEMIQFITSYLFDSRTHLNDMIDRDGNVVSEYWTLDKIPGQRFSADLPVYVLTSKRTFSGAEEFSYNLKNLKRATIVGETTGGGAHPVRGEQINDRFAVRVPFMRANNPISKTNWEGTGVEPDVKVPAPDALAKAIELANAARGKSGK